MPRRLEQLASGSENLKTKEKNSHRQEKHQPGKRGQVEKVAKSRNLEGVVMALVDCCSQRMLLNEEEQ